MLSLFAYGTLKPGEANYHYVAPSVLAATPAWVRGDLYDLPLGYPALTTGRGWVAGLWFQLQGPPHLLARLDDLEDYHPERPQAANEYERRWTPLFTAQGASLGHAWAYWMRRSRLLASQGRWLPGGLWSGQGSGSG